MSSKPKKSKHSSSTDIHIMLEDIHADLQKIKENLVKNQKEVEEYKKSMFEKIEKQNNGVCEVLAEHSVCLKSIVSSFWNTPKYIKQFPIKSEEELLKWEDGINEENKDEMVKTLNAIMGEKGLCKGLPLIIHKKLLLKYNLNGTHNKKGLKFFKNVMDVLFLSYTSSSVNKCEPNTFEKEIRLALRKIKNRHFKDAFDEKKREMKKNADTTAE
ncbi:hypothetical protein FF38_07024 [Lucilia cuprina]|uniref:DUF4806 domain-containing protein n=1 Tax=Lucilia cuprina TaxID=7375 RepID=A0A0L0CAA6_LUCCU|nr:hypothetical protein FF38_07024 [Lucilia cuprina]